MASEFDRKIRQGFSGVDQSKDSHLQSDTSWEDCEGLRPYHGSMENLPQIIKNYEILQIRSNASSQVKLIEAVYDEELSTYNYLCLTETQAWLQDPDALLQTSGTAAQASEQVEVPVMILSSDTTGDDGDSTAHCYVLGMNQTNIATDAPSIGDTLEVEILSATTFQLSSSISGILGTSSPYTIDREVEIDGTDYKVYFYDPATLYQNYNIGDTWTYTRSELPHDSHYDGQSFSRTTYAYELYCCVSDGSVLKYREGVLSSVGSYEPIKGRYVELFTDKLVVGKVIGEDYKISNSALDDVNLWFESLLNEAGSKNFIDNFDASTPTRGVTGLASFQNLLYAYFPSSIHQATYVGVQQGTLYWNQIRSDIGSIFPQCVIKGRLGHYFIGTDMNFYRNSGEELSTIGNAVRDKFRNEVVPRTSANFLKTWGFYNKKEGEVSWVYYWTDSAGSERLKQITYMEDSDNWYFRKLPNETTDEAATDITTKALTLSNENRLHWGAENYLYIDYRTTDCRTQDLLQEDVASSTSAEETIDDGVEIVVAEGEEWIIPTTTPATAFILTTQDITYDTSRPHDLETFWFDANWSQGSSILVEACVRASAAAPIVWEELGEWTPSLKEQILSAFNNQSGKVFKYRLTINPDESSNLLTEMTLKMWTDNIRGVQLEIER